MGAKTLVFVHRSQEAALFDHFYKIYNASTNIYSPIGLLTNNCANGQQFIIILLLQCPYMVRGYCAFLRGFVSRACQVT
jgi:hypothetical protein